MTTSPTLRTLRTLRRRCGGATDRGAAIVAVLGALVLVSALLLASLSYLQHSVRSSRYEQDDTAAEAAAQSGIQDFLTRLRLDGDYVDHADPLSGDPENYCTNPAVAGPDVVLPVLDDGSRVCTNLSGTTPRGWVSVATGAATTGEEPAYHYRLLRYDSVQRDLVLESVGRANGVHRTVQTRIAHPSATDYLYFTDYELTDPTQYPENDAYVGEQTTSAACGALGHGADELTYAWDDVGIATHPRVYGYLAPGSAIAFPQTLECRSPMFQDGDVVEGRVHSNDTIRAWDDVGGPAVFKGQVSTADPRCTLADPTDSSTWVECLHPTHRDAVLEVPPVAVPAPLAMPPITDMAAEAETAGCRYAGATRIVAHADGTMTVWSKDTTAELARTGCGVPGPAPGGLGSAEGATVAVPADGLVYVGDAATAAGRELYAGELGGPAGRELPLGDYTGQAPVNGTSTYSSDVSFQSAQKHAGLGNLYLEGVVQGSATFAAARGVVLTGDLLLADGEHGGHALGVVAGQSIEYIRPALRLMRGTNVAGEWVWRPSPGAVATPVTGWPTRYALPATGVVEPATGLNVQASLMALDGSIRLQANQLTGALGDLRVFGAMAQRFRGAIGTLPTATEPLRGYLKDYRYDSRLDHGLRPPYFPAFGDVTWTVIWTEEHATEAAVRAP